MIRTIKRKLITALDIDNCLCNTTEAVLELYNEDYNDNLTIDDIKSYWIEQYVKPEAKVDFHKYFLNKMMWKKVKPINVEEVRRLLANEHLDVYFTTATCAENCAKKISFLSKVFTDYDVADKFIRTTHKEVINADIRIDDCVDNLIENGKSLNYCVAYPWNECYFGERGSMSEIVADIERLVNNMYR